jgi:hypothetical protein
MTSSKSAPDRLARVRDLITRIALADANIAYAADKGLGFEPKELDELLALGEMRVIVTDAGAQQVPTFPLHYNGVVFRNRRELRVARHALNNKKEWPAGMQAAHERIAFFMREQLDQKKKLGAPVIRKAYITIQASEPVAQNVLRMRRNAQGELREVIDTEPVEATCK